MVPCSLERGQLLLLLQHLEGSQFLVAVGADSPIRLFTLAGVGAGTHAPSESYTPLHRSLFQDSVHLSASCLPEYRTSVLFTFCQLVGAFGTIPSIPYPVF